MQNITLSEEQLKNLINHAQNLKPETTKIKTLDVLEKYLSTHKLTSKSISGYSQTLTKLSQWTEYFPTQSSVIDEFISNLKTYKDIPFSFKSRKTHLSRIRCIAAYMTKAFNLPNPTLNCSKLINKNKEERVIWTLNQLTKIIQTANPEFERKLILCLFDSGCRIGELASTPEHPGLTTNNIFPDNEQIKVYGKTGMHLMHLSHSICLDLIAQANPQGIVFHSQRSPNGYNTDALRMRVNAILKRAQITGKKIGPHTLRHSAASIIAAFTDSALAVQRFLDHSDPDMSRQYIHDVEQMKHKQLSPLDILTEQTHHSNPADLIQISLLPQNNEEQSTALTIANEIPIERVEAVPDNAEERFPHIDPNADYKIRPQLNTKDLLILREVFVDHARHSEPNNRITSHLAQLMRGWFKYSKS
jgi:integrase